MGQEILKKNFFFFREPKSMWRIPLHIPLLSDGNCPAPHIKIGGDMTPLFNITQLMHVCVVY